MKHSRYVIVKRLLSMIEYISKTNDINIDSLALKFKVGIRTVRRDLKALKELNLLEPSSEISKIFYKEIKCAKGRLKSHQKRKDFKKNLDIQYQLGRELQDEIFKNIKD